jgi:hypothetical protein
MTDIFEHLKNKNISESSLKLYLSNLKRLNDNNEIKNFNFLKNTENILNKLKTYKDNTRRTYIISIVSLLKHEAKYKKQYEFYYKLLIDLNNNLKTNTTKSETQSENWISQTQVKEIYDKLETDILNKVKNKKKLDTPTYNELLDYLILSFYVLMPPRRCLDYQSMKFVKSFNEDLDKQFNYLDLSTFKMYFNRYKTEKTYKCKELDVNDDLKKVIMLYLKFYPLKKDVDGQFIIVDHDGKHPTSINYITRVLNRIFNAKISVSMLRSIYLTSKYSDGVKELNDDVKAMGTSVSNSLNQYIKQD